jgi:uncharacterized protein DUF1648
MDIKTYRVAVGTLWIVLPLTALRYWMVWDLLPARVATHFNAAGQANGWMTREAALIFPLAMMTFCLLIATVILSRLKKANAAAWAVWGFFVVILGVIYWGGESVLEYNLHGTPVHALPVLIIVVVAAVILTGVMIGSTRGAALAADAVVAEEVHASPLWAAIMLIPLAIQLGAMLIVPNPVRAIMAVVGLIFIGTAAFAWSGFQYRFTHAGLEIRTLGFRVRSIPVEQIREYSIGNWNVLRGYGIRGIGDRRAYVWCNKGVLIKTSNGEVFLGHQEPERIVRDLDMIRGFVHS